MRKKLMFVALALVVGLMAAACAPPSYAGEVHMVSTSPTQMLVGKDNGDGTTTLFYIEATQTLPYVDESFKDGVLNLEDGIVMVNSKGRSYNYWIASEGEPAFFDGDWRSHRSTAKAMAAFTIYGNIKVVMSQYAFERVLVAPYDTLATKCIDGKVTEDDSCQHGGPGSTSGYSPGFTCATVALEGPIGTKKSGYISLGVNCNQDYYPCGSCEGMGSHTCKPRACGGK